MRDFANTAFRFDNLIGESRKMRDVFGVATHVEAANEGTIFLDEIGELPPFRSDCCESFRSERSTTSAIHIPSK